MDGKSFRMTSIRFTDSLVFNLKMNVNRFRYLYRFLRSPRRFVSPESYFPEEELKSRHRIFFEQLGHILKYGEVNKYYFTYGLDRKVSKPGSYAPFSNYMYLKDRKNAEAGGLSFNFLCLLRDKLSFGAFCQGAGIPVPGHLAVIDSGQAQLLGIRKTISVEKIIDYDIDGFCKPRYGQRGRDAFALRILQGKAFINGQAVDVGRLVEILAAGEWIVQERLATQHEVLSRLYPHAINTIRLVTVDTGKMIETLGAALRVGTGGRRVDNWSAGGILIPLDLATGKLMRYGYYNPAIGRKAARHPDTDVTFEDFQVPMVTEAVREALYLHKLMKGIHSIGWDISITSNGPVFIEGNDQWHTAVSQIALGGMKTSFNRLFR
ncbi:MAG TPA: sugar-transfer associated ATP-grasp domain-containing protein [Sphingobacteriaceae bacterium]